MNRFKRFIKWFKELLSMLGECRHELTDELTVSGVAKFIFGVVVCMFIFIGLKSCYNAVDPGIAITDLSSGECYLFDGDDWACNGCCGNEHPDTYFLYGKKGQGVRKYESSKYKMDNFVLPASYTKFCNRM